MRDHESIISLLESVKQARISPDRFVETLRDLSVGRTRQGYFVQSGELEIYRTRTYRTGYRPRRTSELSYPPLKYSVQGRANKVGQQIFYASLGMPTTLAETNASAGDYVITSRWRNTRTCGLQKVGLDMATEPLENLYEELFCDRTGQFFPYSAEVATQLCSGDEIAGIAYPSMANEDRSINLALKKEYVDTSLRCHEATCVYIEEVKPGRQYKTQQIDYAKPHGKQLRWRGHRKQWALTYPGQEVLFEANGWDWVGTDRATGLTVEPD